MTKSTKRKPLTIKGTLQAFVYVVFIGLIAAIYFGAPIIGKWVLLLFSNDKTWEPSFFASLLTGFATTLIALTTGYMLFNLLGSKQIFQTKTRDSFKKFTFSITNPKKFMFFYKLTSPGPQNIRKSEDKPFRKLVEYVKSVDPDFTFNL